MRTHPANISISKHLHCKRKHTVNRFTHLDSRVTGSTITSHLSKRPNLAKSSSKSVCVNYCHHTHHHHSTKSEPNTAHTHTKYRNNPHIASSLTHVLCEASWRRRGCCQGWRPPSRHWRPTPCDPTATASARSRGGVPRLHPRLHDSQRSPRPRRRQGVGTTWVTQTHLRCCSQARRCRCRPAGGRARPATRRASCCLCPTCACDLRRVVRVVGFPLTLRWFLPKNLFFQFVYWWCAKMEDVAQPTLTAFYY